MGEVCLLIRRTVPVGKLAVVGHDDVGLRFYVFRLHRCRFTDFVFNLNKCKMGTRKNPLKAYLITWYGPFLSIEETDEWQRQNDIDSCLYFVQGKRPGAKAYSYYCGRTHRTAPKRFRDKYHHINEIPNHRNIWVGAFENKCNSEAAKIAENMFIDLLYGQTGETQCLNQRSLSFQKHDYDIFFINKWHNPKHHPQPKRSVKTLIPEVVAYFADTDEVKTSQKLHSL